jgi:tRNA (guanosine-2'-O-)-methyltransferase
MNGYYGIGIYHPKKILNLGTLWRSAHNFGAKFIFTIGQRYHKQPSDTTKAFRHVPLFNFLTWEDFREHIPHGCLPVFVEQAETAKNIVEFKHPKSAVYILGAEDHGVPESLMKGYRKVFIDTPMCLNVSVAGSIIMFDRASKINHAT